MVDAIPIISILSNFVVIEEFLNSFFVSKILIKGNKGSLPIPEWDVSFISVDNIVLTPKS